MLVQGTTIPMVARALRVDAPLAERPAWPVEPGMVSAQGTTLHELRVGDHSPVAGHTLLQLGVPPGVIVVLVQRSGTFVVPQGMSELLAGDELLVIGTADGVDELRRRLEGDDAGRGQPAS